MPEPHVSYELRGPAAWITIQREQRRNALSPQAVELLGQHLDRAAADDAVRAVCLTGAGERAFCAGADLMAAMGQGVGGGGRRRNSGFRQAMLGYAQLLQRMASHPKVLVARVNGHCIGGGLGLLLSCDIAYCRQGARLGTPELDVGLFPMMVAPLLLRAAPRGQALEMIYSAAVVSADEALQLGLVTRVLPPEELDQAVQDLLARIGAKAPVALRRGRLALAEIEGMALEPALEHMSEQLALLLKTQDAIEGLMAFAQKRKPQWKGS